MNIEDRITVSTEDVLLRLEQTLDRFHRFRYDGRYKEWLGESLLSHIEEWDNKIRDRKRDPLTVVVAGEFKRGKSSFINAFLGEKTVTTDVTPETVTINRIRYGIHKNEAVLSGGRRMTLTDDELSRAALEKVMSELGEPIRQLELWRPNERLRDICIIDTPGLNDVSGDFDPLVAEALAQADAVIYMYSISYPLSRSEQMFLKYSILPQNYTKLFLVGNYGDLANTEEDLGRLRELLRKRTELLLPNEPIYLISALDELCRTFGTARPCEELASTLERDFGRLRQDLEHLIEEKKSVITADRMLRLSRVMVKELEIDLTNLEKGMEMDAVQLSTEREALESEKSAHIEHLAAAQEKIDELIDTRRSDTKRWMEEVLEKLEREELSGYSVQDLYQYYSYYCVDIIQTALRACLEQHREELLEEMSGISDALGKNLAGSYTTNDAFSFRLTLDSNTWTRGDSVTLVITQLSGNALINALTDLTGSLLRKNEMENDKDGLLKSIKSKYPALRTELDQFIASQYRALGQTAKDLLSEYYQGLIDRAEAVVGQYAEAAKKNQEEKAQTAAAIVEVREVLSTLSAVLA